MTLYLVVLMCLLSQVGFSGSRVVVSLYALELGASQIEVGVIIALFAFCATTLSIVIGRYADRAPPHLPVIAGSVAMVAVLLLPPFFGNLVILGLVAFIMGFSHQVFSLPLEAMVGGIGGPARRAANYTVITLGWSIANMLGPLITGFLIDAIGHARVFYVLAAFVAAPLAIMAAWPGLVPREAAHKDVKGEQRGSVAELWRIKPLRTIIIASGVVGSAQDLFQFYMPIYGHAIGLSASAIGTVLSMVAVAAFVVRSFIPVLVRHVSEFRIMNAAVFLSGAMFVLIPFFTNAWILGAIAFVLGLGVGCALPMTLSLLYALSPPGRVAEAIGINKTVRHGTHLVVPMIFGSVGALFGYTTVFLSNALLLGGSGWLMRKVKPPKVSGGGAG